ncbi:MAG: CheR family methyltransferase [Polyangiaceae bacterium]
MTQRAAHAWTSTGPAEPTSEEFDDLRELVQRHAGIHLNASKRALVYSRLAQRLQQLGMRTFGEYLRCVSRDATELEKMTDRITTNETHFFREPAHWEVLCEKIIPGWVRAADDGHRQKTLRVWSAGCSTGEEPYSLAMALLERLPPSSGWTIHINATDISTRALDVARHATWSMDRAREIPAHLLKRFMLQGVGSQAGKLRAGPELRELVKVDWLNLSNRSYAVGASYDAVFCRNVLIYFEPDLRRRVVEQLLSHVSPGGYFFVGHAESVQGLRAITCLQPTVYRKNGLVEAEARR